MKSLIVVLALVLGGCATGPSPQAQSEYAAYYRYLNAEYLAGRITKPQGEYLLQKRANELARQQDISNAALINAFGEGLQGGRTVECFSTGPFTSCK